jgi:hypothetical protein
MIELGALAHLVGLILRAVYEDGGAVCHSHLLSKCYCKLQEDPDWTCGIHAIQEAAATSSPLKEGLV